MQTAAAEYTSNIGHDFTLADAYDPEYMETEEADDEAERQRVNRAMAEWFGLS